MGYCLASSLLAVTSLFNYPHMFPGSYFPGADLGVLGYIMQAEFLAAASGILIVLPLLFPARSRALRLLRLLAFMVLGYFCAWIASTIDGTSGMLWYSLLVFLTFGCGMLFVFDWLSSEVLLYPLLTWYLENNIRQERLQEVSERLG